MSSMTAVYNAARGRLLEVLPPTALRQCRKWKVQRTIHHYEPYTASHTYAGHQLKLHIADPLAQGWYDDDREQLPISLEFLRDHGVLCPGARVLDVGAHQAFVALLMERIVSSNGHTGEVIAVEAEPHNVSVAERNVALNGARNLTVVHGAGAANEGLVIPFAHSFNGSVDLGAWRGTVGVPSVTVDGLAARYGVPDLVFIDVEGYEDEVLKGARLTLANGRTTFLIEIHDQESLARYGSTAAAVARRFEGFHRHCSPGADRAPFFPLQGEPPRERFFFAAFPAGTTTAA